MERVKLHFENIQQIVGSDELSVILLADDERKRALSIICDKLMTDQLMLRLQSRNSCTSMLPESLVQMLPDEYEMMVYGLHNGQYQVVLADKEFNRSVRLRISDAVLLSIVAGYPLYIEERLMNTQSVPFDENATGVAIPINTMDIQRLNLALENAIDTENYELASQLRDEIRIREKSDTLKKSES